jgi:acylpyruvate hydrolase
MQLVTFQLDQEARIGVLTADGASIVDLSQAAPDLPRDMKSLLAAGESALIQAQHAAAQPDAAVTISRAAVTLRAPVLNPGKILCIGLNYRDHAAESSQTPPDFPTVFVKTNNTVNDPGAAIVLPKNSTQVDYECELGVVIGRYARHVHRSEALRYVVGYLPFHDVSARDYQHRISQWTLGKSFDGFAPMGPALVTADEVGDPHNLDIQLTVNGEVLQRSNTRHLIFPVDVLIEELSSVMTLEPGDIIATGTPSGVGAARKPPRFLQPGDVVRIEIAKLGVLENPVEAEARE